MSNLYVMAAAGLVGAIVLISLLASIFFRTVVSTNDVHIVQASKKTTPYGKDMDGGNTYYAWPAWFPFIGIRVTDLPLSVFDVNLEEYAGYDKGRVPFIIDVMAFFRIEQANMAAERVRSFAELKEQLHGILKDVTRSILAKAEIEEILEERAKFGEAFTVAVNAQLKAWGVTNVKNIALMDVRDADGSKVIENIMAKKKSFIERESRVAVADNTRAAKEAEIAASQMVLLRDQEAQQSVGQRTAEKDKQIGIAQQKATQEVLGEKKTTATADMAVKMVNEVRTAEIARDVQVVQADQQRQMAVIAADAAKEVMIVNAQGEKTKAIVIAEGEKTKAIIIAEGSKSSTVTVAQGNLEQALMRAQGTEAEGKAEGAAKTAVALAPVTAAAKLAETIGGNKEYQAYLVEIRVVEKDEAIGVAQAEALTKASIKIMANAGDVPSGMNQITDVMSSKGGMNLGAMLEAFVQTPTGSQLISKITGRPPQT